jgi:membrane-associated phospholipid phosphatase
MPRWPARAQERTMSEGLPGRALVEVEEVQERERLTRFARLVSNLFSPAALALPVMVLGVYVSHVPGTWRYAVLFTAVAVLLPLLDMSYLMAAGKVSDFHLDKRHERRRPFLVSTLCLSLALVLFRLTDAPPVMMAMAQATLLQTLVLFVITLGWKISIHMATVTSVVTFMLLAFGSEALAFLAVIPLVGWARLLLKRHNLPQLVAGGIVGISAKLVCLAGVLY